MVLSPGFCRSDLEASRVYSKLFLEHNKSHRPLIHPLGSFPYVWAQTWDAAVWMHAHIRWNIPIDSVMSPSAFAALPQITSSSPEVLLDVGLQTTSREPMKPCYQTRGLEAKDTKATNRWQALWKTSQDMLPAQCLPSKGCKQEAGRPLTKSDLARVALFCCFYL